MLFVLFKSDMLSDGCPIITVGNVGRQMPGGRSVAGRSPENVLPEATCFARVEDLNARYRWQMANESRAFFCLLQSSVWLSLLSNV